VVDAEPLMVDLRRAIAVGLILNELISNAFKHAFPGGRAGTVVIRIAREGEVIEIGVSDDGVGLPDPVPTGSFGLRLVRILTEQVRGSLRLEGSNGTSVVVRFGVAQPASATPDPPGR
jgi:two-component sensor histidine kinase